MTKVRTRPLPGWWHSLSLPVLTQRIVFVVMAILLLSPPLPILPGTPDVVTSPATLQTHSSIRVLYLSGTPYQLGYQQGVLLQKDLRALVQDRLYLTNAAQGSWSYPLLLAYARRVEPYLSPDLRQEIRGIADGAGLSYHDILAWNVLDSFLSVENRRDMTKDILFGWRWSLLPPQILDEESFQPPRHKGLVSTMAGLSGLASLGSRNGTRKLVLPAPGAGFAAWGSALGDRELRLGKQIHLDAAGPYGEEPIIVVYHPSHGIPFWSLTWPGTVGTMAGFNEAKLALYVSVLPSSDTTADGVPVSFLARQALQYTVDETTALTLMLSTQKTGGATVVLGDGKVPHAQRLELSAHFHTIQETDDDFLPDPPAFAADRILAAVASDHSVRSSIPWRTLKQQLLVGREPETTAMQALQHGADNADSRLAILLQPAFLTAVIQRGTGKMNTYHLQ